MVYSTVLHYDTTTVTLIDTNILVITPAGNFYCNRFKYTEPGLSGDSSFTKTSWLWLNNRYGVIKQEVVNPVDSTGIKTQVLSTKNF